MKYRLVATCDGRVVVVLGTDVTVATGPVVDVVFVEAPLLHADNPSTNEAAATEASTVGPGRERCVGRLMMEMVLS
jgi:hypothetical protein